MNRILLTAIGVCLALQLHLAFAQPINWDEFRFLADVHAHARGELSLAVQTFHVHFFGWLAGIGSEIDQIAAARVVMLLLELGTMILIYGMARRLFDVAPALFAALAYVSFSFVLRHGASFRFDPMSTFLLMSAASLLLAPRLRWMGMILVGFAVPLALMITVKSAFYLPLLGAIAAWRLATVGKLWSEFGLLSIAAVTAALVLPLLYLMHLGSLAAADALGSQSNVVQSYEKTVGQGLFFPRLGEFVQAVAGNPLHWLFLLLGLTTAVKAAVRGPSRSHGLLLCAFALPLLPILFYRNAFPYFYAFMLAPAALLVAAASARPEWRPRLSYVGAAMLIAALFHHQAGLSPAVANQRRIIAEVHRIFPQPVPYIDRASMISSFPQAGLFLSSWGIESYLGAKRPIMRDMLLKRQPVFVIANSPLLAEVFEFPSTEPAIATLLPQDRQVLKANFIPHWGPLFVAGKALHARQEPQSFELLIGGRYTLESEAPILIDHQLRKPGEAVALTPGTHSVQSPDMPRALTLRWGNRLHRPTTPAPRGPIFGTF